MSRIVVDAIRNSSASTDGITLASNGSVTIPNLTATTLTTNSNFGKILQVVQAVKTDTTSTSTALYNGISGLQPSITPSSTSNKVLITIDLKLGHSNAGADVNLQLFRSVGGTETQICLGDASSNRKRTFFGGQNTGQSDTTSVIPVSTTFLDSPNTTSAVTYLVKWAIERGGTYLYLNRSGLDTDDSTYFRAVSTITLQEVAA